MYLLPCLGSASDWLKQTFNQSKALHPDLDGNTSSEWIISFVVPQMSFLRETHVGTAEWYLLSQRLKSERDK